MRRLTITTAGSRKSAVWQPQEVTWPEFCERLRTPQRGSETYREYISLPKSQQDMLKDVGGFVGGKFKFLKRRLTDLTSRDLITLDLDNIPSGTCEVVIQSVEALGYSACIYSTRKHTARKPRLRVILPIDREVTPDEHEPIARRIADMIGIDYCDPTTFEGNRLMYWPSCSSDAEYIHKVTLGPWLSADDVLGSYKDWHDITEWPRLSDEEASHTRSVAKAEDPMSKKGVIGAFCRCYDIESAMDELLSGLYSETTEKNRRTYCGGSTYGGAVIYGEGRFLYSHHATDPCGGRLVNAWDLVRIQKYGKLDDDAREGTPVSRLPSTKAMTDLAMGDKKVADLLNRERAETAREAFSEDYAEVDKSIDGEEKDATEGDNDWMNDLSKTDKGAIQKTIGNCVMILEKDPNLSGAIATDDFAGQGMVVKPLPWNKSDKKRRFCDADLANVHSYIESVYGIDSYKRIDEALTIVGDRHHYNDVEEYLTNLKWDGVPRVETLMQDYLGAEDNIYTRAVMRKTLAAAVGRAIDGGTKWDFMPILAGPQGLGKSTFLRYLGKAWFSDSLTTFEGKDAAELVQGIWIVEVGELTAMSRQETNSVKQFLSKVDDQYRVAYGRYVSSHPRRCVFFGTSNDVSFLKDQTGNRRFWPIDVGLNTPTKDVWDDLPSEIDQVWAEAYVYHMLGEPLYLIGEEDKLAKEAQEGHRDESAKEGLIRAYVDRFIPEDWYSMDRMSRRAWMADPNNGMEMEAGLIARNKVCAAEVWEECMGGDMKYLDRTKTMEINSILRNIPNWVESNGLHFGKYGKGRGFRREGSGDEVFN